MLAAVQVRWEGWRARPVRLRFWREFAYVALFDLVYEWTSEQAGTNRSVAYHHAMSVVRLEHHLGLLQEHTIQVWALHSRLFIELADLFYATVHFVMPVVGLTYLFRRFPERYLPWRDMLAWTTALALGCFAVFPLMPPRMLPSSHGVIDTMQQIGGLGSWDTVLLKDAGNQFAAMPSLHISWALWACLALYPVVRRRWIRWLLVADPIVTTVTILVTGNHYVLDILGGVAVLVAGWALARVTPRFLPRRFEPTAVPPPAVVPVPTSAGARVDG